MKKTSPSYLLAPSLLLWAVAMEGRWPKKRKAIKATFRHYLAAAKLHDAIFHKK